MTITVIDNHCWEYMSVYYKYELKDLRRNYIVIILRYTVLNLFLFSMVQRNKQTNFSDLSLFVKLLNDI